MRQYDFAFTEEITQSYRKLFSSGNGLFVLSHMLHDLGAFRPISDDPEEVALRNFGIRIMAILSGGQPTGENINRFMKGLMSQPIPKERGEDL